MLTFEINDANLEQKIIENTIGNISLVTFPCLKILTERGYWS